ncbi:MAG: ATPase [Clostridiales bacterium]|nr:ATPase [Clostridiales bacterium]
MITKMNFISITGPKNDIDRVVEKYVSKYDFQVENALAELKTVTNLTPYIEANPYKVVLTKADRLVALLKNKDYPNKEISLETSLSVIHDLDKEANMILKEKNELETELSNLQASMLKISPFRGLDYDLNSILEFKHVKFRFGKISHEYFAKFEKYLYDDLYTIFYKCLVDDDYVWGVYFVPASESNKIDAIYSSLHFERIFLKDEYEGTPTDAYNELKKKLDDFEIKLNEINNQLDSLLDSKAEELISALYRIKILSQNFDIRKMAACTKSHKQVFYILCGWMTEKDALILSEKIKSDPNLYCFIEEDHDKIESIPPTKLKNPGIFKPFEMFTRMYGLPNYYEFDPTIFLAITYALIFGIMFGDVGQGVFLFIGGLLLYKFKKMDLGGIIASAGVFSTIFGFMYGSLFGFEDVIDAVWLHPMTNMTALPFIGNLNTVFVYSIGFGMGLILLTIIFNIINNLKVHNLEAALFDTNGIAGLVFYGSLVLVIVLFMSGNTVPSGVILTVMFLLPLLVIMFKEPLTAIIEKKAEVMPKEKGMFIVQGLFELIEVLLSYFSNTLSFVRIGAFAISHAAMMEVVLMLAGAENGGSPNWIVVVLGNIFVVGMEGLIVGIQVLRLEYYEFFSRFYKGSGREFKPYSKIKNI